MAAVARISPGLKYLCLVAETKILSRAQRTRTSRWPSSPTGRTKHKYIDLLYICNDYIDHTPSFRKLSDLAHAPARVYGNGDQSKLQRFTTPRCCSAHHSGLLGGSRLNWLLVSATGHLAVQFMGYE